MYSVNFDVLLVFLLTGVANCAQGSQIDAVVLDELLREIVDSSMSDLRHRLQEAVFATAFRRRIQQHTSATSSSIQKESNDISAIDKILDDYIKPQKLSLALETYTTTTSRPVQLITVDDVAFLEGSGSESSGRMFDDAFKEPLSAGSSLPRVPVWVAVTVCVACVLTFFVLIGTIVYYVSQRRSQRTQNFGLNQRRMMPDPMTVQGLCHTTSSCNLGPISNSRRNSFIIDQDRAASSIWANP